MLLSSSLPPLAAKPCQLRPGRPRYEGGMCFAAAPLLPAGGLLPNIEIAAAPRLRRGGRGRCALEAEADGRGSGSDPERDREDDASCVRICRYKKFFYEGATNSLTHSLSHTSLNTSFGPLKTRSARFKPIDSITLSHCSGLLGWGQAGRGRDYQISRKHRRDVTWHSTCIIITFSSMSKRDKACHVRHQPSFLLSLQARCASGAFETVLRSGTGPR